MQKFLRLSRLLDAFSEWVGQLTAWLSLLMIFLGVWNVLGRYLGRLVGQNLSSNALIEGQWYIFDLLFLLGAAYALKHDEHVRVDVFYHRWPPKWRALVDLLGTLLLLIPFCVLVIVFSSSAIAESWRIWEISPDPGGLPRYPIKTMIIVSFALLILQGISQAIKNWAIFIGQLSPQEERHDAGL